MKRISAVLVLSIVMFGLGCDTTKTVRVHSETTMITGNQMSCIYHAEDLYCASPLLKAQDIDKLQIMTKVVSLIHEEENEGEFKENGTFAAKFDRSPKDYSVWDCVSTGAAEPAVKCTLLREADAKLVAQQLQEIKLNAVQEMALEQRTSEQSTIASCGAPIEQKSDSISRTMYLASSQNGVWVEVEFNTFEKPTALSRIQPVEQRLSHIDGIPELTHAYAAEGWSNFSNIGKTDEEKVPIVRNYLPCILK